LTVVIVWLVILPKFQSISDSSANETPEPKAAWPTRIVSAAGEPPAEPSITGTAPAASAAAHYIFRYVLAAYEHEADADRRIQLLNKKHPDLDVRKWTKSPAGPFYVVAGGPMSEPEANELRKKAVHMGISRASYVIKLAN